MTSQRLMKLTKEDIGIKKKLNAVMIIAFAAIYALCCFVISPLYAAAIADVAYASGVLPVFLSYFDSLLAVLAISVAYSVIILGKYRLGVDKYRCSLRGPRAYIETIKRIQEDKEIHNVLFSHAYEPWYNDQMMGRENVESCLVECMKYIGEIK